MNKIPERRQYSRHEIPVEINAPALSDAPMLAENASVGGFRVLATKKLKPGTTFEISFEISGLSFERCEGIVAWVEERAARSGAWPTGVLIRMTDEEREKFLNAVEKLIQEKG
ncbi:MAG: PilZ domain-containing protein [bacterium]